MYHIFFIYSSVDGHLGLFHILAIVNSAAVNIGVHVSFFFLIYFIYLYLAVLGLRCSTWVFFSCGEWGLLFVAVRGLLIVVASLVVEHRL